MKKILQSLFLIGFIFLISGCSQKATPTIEYIKEEKYPFQFINLEGLIASIAIGIEECKIPHISEHCP